MRAQPWCMHHRLLQWLSGCAPAVTRSCPLAAQGPSHDATHIHPAPHTGICHWCYTFMLKLSTQHAVFTLSCSNQAPNTSLYPDNPFRCLCIPLVAVQAYCAHVCVSPPVQCKRPFARFKLHEIATMLYTANTPEGRQGLDREQQHIPQVCIQPCAAHSISGGMLTIPDDD